MTTPLTLPCLPADLSRLVASLWGDHGDGRGVAREAGVDPREVSVHVAELLGGGFGLSWYMPGPRGGAPGSGIFHALSALADALRDAGLVVDESAGVRVVGWAAVDATVARLVCGGPRWGAGLVRIVDLDPRDPRREAHDSAVVAARLARRGAPVADAKRAHGERTAAAHRASVRGGKQWTGDGGCIGPYGRSIGVGAAAVREDGGARGRRCGGGYVRRGGQGDDEG